MDKEHTAIARIQEAARTSERYYKKPLIITTSGGKDSSVCVELALRAGIDFELMHNHTTADAPETVLFLRSEYKRLEALGFPSEQIIINYPVYKQSRKEIRGGKNDRRGARNSGGGGSYRARGGDRESRLRARRYDGRGSGIVGRKHSRARLLVLSERKTRYEIIIRMADGTTSSVVRALNRLERQYGAAFSEVFKTITVDNGSEFADCEGIEKSCRRSGARTTLYYCHPYTSCERGTNENINRMIRWHFPKGTSFDEVSAREVAAVAEWINEYPREILGYQSADMLFSEELSLAA